MHMNEYLARERHRELLASAAQERLARQAMAGRRRLPRFARIGLWYAGWYLPGPARTRRWLMHRIGEEEA